MKTNRKELLEALEIVKPGLASKEQIEQTTSFAFMKGRVVTYNDEISISHPVENVGFEGAITADVLYNYLTKLKQDEIDVDLQGEELRIKAGRSKAGFALQSEIKLPLQDELEKEGVWQALPEKFLKGIAFARSCCAKDMSQPKLTCIHANETGFVEGSDGYRIARYRLNEPLPIPTFLLPAISCITLEKLQPTQIATGVGWVHFKCDSGTEISCRIFEDQYPKADEFFKMKGKEIQLPTIMNEVLDRAVVFAKREHVLDEDVDVKLKKNRMTVEAKAPSGWFSETINVKFDEEPIEISITPYVLKDILNETDMCEVSENRLKFAGELWEYVTVLRNVDE